MKKDVNELKKMFFDILQNPAMTQQAPVYTQDNSLREISSMGNGSNYVQSNSPVILPNRSSDTIQAHEEVEESLSIMDKEKELIIKALKKHRGKRRDASLDLGISERTLYRKLKEYDIEDL